MSNRAGLRATRCSAVDVFACIAAPGARPASVNLAGFCIDPATFAGLRWNIPFLGVCLIGGVVAGWVARQRMAAWMFATLLLFTFPCPE